MKNMKDTHIKHWQNQVTKFESLYRVILDRQLKTSYYPSNKIIRIIKNITVYLYLRKKSLNKIQNGIWINILVNFKNNWHLIIIKL